MYMPYLWGKQNEFLALLELQESMETFNCLPIIEPVTISNIKYLNRLNESKIGYVLVINPNEGDYEEAELDELELSYIKENHEVMFAYKIDRNTEISEVNTFIKDFDSYKICFIHMEGNDNSFEIIKLIEGSNCIYNIVSDKLPRKLVRQLKQISQCVKLCDVFQKAETNSDYPEESFYTDYHNYYEEEGYEAYSDFTVVSGTFKKGGFQPTAVAIHFSIIEDSSVYIKHFLSDDRRKQGEDTPKKVVEAIKHLQNF